MKRGTSANNYTNNYTNTKNIAEMLGEQPFVSTELHRFMVKKKDLPVGHQFHSPQHNRFDAVRDDSVYNSVGGGSGLPSSQWSRSGASTSLNKLKDKLQKRTHGLTSEQLSRAANPG